MNNLSLVEAVKQFSDEEAMEEMFIKTRWPEGISCPQCDSQDVQERPTRKPSPYRCRSCRYDFSVKTGTVMESSKLPLSKWALCTYLMATNPKGISSVQLSKDLGVRQSTAWHMAHRIRKAWEGEHPEFYGPVEVDEVYLGGKEKNKHSKKRLHPKGGGSGKAAVVGIKDRRTNTVYAKHMPDTDATTIRTFIGKHTNWVSQIYTDEHPVYRGMKFRHESVQHRSHEYVRGRVHTNGIESFWALLKRGYYGTYHKMSPKHLQRYVTEFSERYNGSELEVIDQIRRVIAGMSGKKLRYKDLVAQTIQTDIYNG